LFYIVYVIYWLQQVAHVTAIPANDMADAWHNAEHYNVTPYHCLNLLSSAQW